VLPPNQWDFLHGKAHVRRICNDSNNRVSNAQRSRSVSTITVNAASYGALSQSQAFTQTSGQDGASRGGSTEGHRSAGRAVRKSSSPRAAEQRMDAQHQIRCRLPPARGPERQAPSGNRRDDSDRRRDRQWPSAQLAVGRAERPARIRARTRRDERRIGGGRQQTRDNTPAPSCGSSRSGPPRRSRFAPNSARRAATRRPYRDLPMGYRKSHRPRSKVSISQGRGGAISP